jgi:hypothetical protein
VSSLFSEYEGKEGNKIENVRGNLLFRKPGRNYSGFLGITAAIAADVLYNKHLGLL